jgi:hypothetical protein
MRVVDQSCSTPEAFALLEQGIHRLLIVGDGRPLNVLSQMDAIRALRDRKARNDV